MKVLMSLRQLVLGGTTVNAIELAAKLKATRGWDVVLFSAPGPLSMLAEQRGVRVIPAPDEARCPSVVLMKSLRAAVRRERPDVINAWEWCQSLEALYSVHIPMRIPLVVTDMLMDVTRVLPKEVPTTYGTPELVDRARAQGRAPVELIVPPVDTDADAPGFIDSAAFRNRWAISGNEVVLVSVSRLDRDMKGESLMRTIQVVSELGTEIPLRFMIVGDGNYRAELEASAQAANRKLGRSAIRFTGAMLDPREAYASADIVVGMGGSALRGMSFAKPVIVLGERGFALPMNPETSDALYYRGMFGIGAGTAGNAVLAESIRNLAQDAGQRAEWGQFGREFVLDRFSMQAVANRLGDFCQKAVENGSPAGRLVRDALRTAMVYMRERKFQFRYSPVPKFSAE